MFSLVFLITGEVFVKVVINITRAGSVTSLTERVKRVQETLDKMFLKIIILFILFQIFVMLFQLSSKNYLK